MKHFKSLLLILFIAIQAPVSAQTTEKNIAGISLERLKRYENFINAEIDQGNIPGAVSLIVKDGQVVNNASYGFSNLGTKTPMKVDDLFFIQSMTKPIISVAFMMLYEEGHFMLTDPVSKYIPAFKDLKVSKHVKDGATGESEPLKSEITIAQLLSHTSGLTHGLGSSQLDKDFSKEYFQKEYADIKARVASIPKIPLVGQPGNQWYYSVAPDVLSVLIEQFSGKSTKDFLSERIFIPLGMKDTGYNLTRAQQARVVKVTSKTDGSLTTTEYQPKMEGNKIWSGVNALYSTAADYMAFCQMLLNGGQANGKQFLSPKTIELMTSNHSGKLYNRPGEGFGLGFAVLLDGAESKLLGSEGLYYWAGAFNTHFFIDPKEKMVSIFMTHEAHFNQVYHDKMRQLVYQAFVD
jgi:CubicO group peptidase (beta-lactamase class C family)